MRFQFRGLWFSAVVLAGGVLLCSVLILSWKYHRSEPSANSGVPAGVIPGTNSFALPESLPKQGGPPGYVTSATCKECHPKQFESWWRSYHRQMTQLMNSNTVKAKF